MTTHEQQALAKKLRAQAAALHSQGDSLIKIAAQIEAACTPAKKETVKTQDKASGITGNDLKRIWKEQQENEQRKKGSAGW